MKLKAFSIFFICLFLGACVSSRLTKENYNKLQTIAVDSYVILPIKATYYDPTPGQAAAIGGMVGGLIASTGEYNNPDITNYMEANNIDIGEIVANEFSNQIKSKSSFTNKIKSENSNATDASFKLVVHLYGLGKSHSFSSEYQPLVRLEAKLIKNNGELIWQNDDYITSMDEQIKGVPLEVYFNDPLVMKTKFKEVVKLAVSSVLENIEPK